MKKNNNIEMFQKVLCYLRENKNSEVVSILNDIELEVVDSDGRTLLHHAVIEGCLNIVEVLLKKGVDCSPKDDEEWTPLHYAVQNYNADIVELLLKYGADINAQDSNGNTVIWRAVFASKGNGDVINILIEHNADPYIYNNRGVSAIDLAGRIGNYDVKQYFK